MGRAASAAGAWLRLDAAAARAGAAVALTAAYAALATGYALRTPAWQVPDEPAHFNYVQHLASARGLPVLAPGAYPAERLEALKAARFAPPVDIAGLDYESHQPPLYYALAMPAYRLAGDGAEARLRAIRLLGVVLGLATVAAAWRTGRLLIPGEPVVALGAAAFAGLLPMNLALSGGATNDALATPLGAWLVLLAVLRARGRLSRHRYALVAGAALGAALWTKVGLYPLALAVYAAAYFAERSPPAPATPWRAAALAVAPLAIGLAVAAPWFWRNAGVYGATDPLGLAAHHQIASDQLQTSAVISAEGEAALLRRLVRFTFASFWGVFGWMGSWLAPWCYQLLAVISVALVAGAVRALRRVYGARGDPRPWWRGVLADGAATVLLVALGATAAGFAVYNLSFVQHQGRYLFPALVPIALAAGAGSFELGRLIAERTAPRHARAAGAAAVWTAVIALGVLAYLALDRYIPGLAS